MTLDHEEARLKLREGIVWVVAAAALAGCPDYVSPGAYGAPDDEGGADASAGSSAASGDVSGASDDGSAGAPAGDASGPGAPTGPCNLTGRWLVSLRTVTDALGVSEASHEWYYFEISQSGTDMTITKGLQCGMNVRALSATGANVDWPKTWPAMMANISYTGHKGTSTPTSNGCQVTFNPADEVVAATESYYTDESNNLPTASQEASGSTPGWLDWDNDGQPGFTMNVTGLATGELYMVIREHYSLGGPIAASASSFTLPLIWSNNQDVLGINGPSILSETAMAVKDGNAANHFATYVRLSASQATGSDSSICTAIRSLAPTLAPKAND